MRIAGWTGVGTARFDGSGRIAAGPSSRTDDFIFIDGDPASRERFENCIAWKGLVQPGEIVAIHDGRSTATRAIDDTGSMKVTNGVILRDDRFEAREVVDSYYLRAPGFRMSISVSTARVDLEPPSRRPGSGRVLFLVEGFTTFDSSSDSARFAISR